MKSETQYTKIYGCSKSSCKKEVHSDTGLPKETRKLSNKYLTSHLKELAKEQMKPKVRRGNKTLKIRTEISETETKNSIKMVNEIRADSLKG